jgi:hypothetical protein
MGLRDALKFKRSSSNANNLNGFQPNGYPNSFQTGFNPNGIQPSGFQPNGFPNVQQNAYPQNGYTPNGYTTGYTNGYTQNPYVQNGFAPHGSGSSVTMPIPSPLKAPMTTITNIFPSSNPSDPAPADTVGKRDKGRKVSNVEIRDLRELARERYALDVRIWGLRDVLPAMRPAVYKDMVKADALMDRIVSLIKSMGEYHFKFFSKLTMTDKREYFENERQWAAFSQIKQRILADGKRKWTQHAPWG